MLIHTDGHVDVTGNLDVGAGIDCTGNITSTGSIVVTNTGPLISLVDSNNNPDYILQNVDGKFRVRDTTNSVDRLAVNTDGHIDIAGNLDCLAGVDVTGDITVSGTVDGRDLASDGTYLDSLYGGSNGVIDDDVTVQSTVAQSDNSNKVATTAYVRTAISEAQAFPSGTKMLFQQTSAPTGWTKITSSVDNKALRLVSGTVGSGGNATFTAAFSSYTPAGNVGATGNSTASFSGSVSGNTGNSGASTSSVSTSGTVNNHTLTTAQMPSHSHTTGYSFHDSYSSDDRPQWTNDGGGNRNFNSNNTGGGGSHSHGFSGSSHSHNVNNHTHSFSGNFSGNTGNHTHNAGGFTGTARDFAVQYIDVIVCSKD